MTDKEIIIDGVNVAGCGFYHPEYNDNACHIALAFSDQYGECWKCEQNPNCDYKEYKRKEQECEELRGTLNKRKEEIKNLNYVLYEERELTLDLGKANLKIAQLERDISSHKHRFKYEIDKLRKELSSLLAEKNALEIGRDEYKQECEELKEELQTSKDDHAYAVELEKDIDRYKLVLEKIEEIFKNDADGDYDFIKFKIFNIINDVKE